MKQPPAHTIASGVIFMYPNGSNFYGIWGSDNYPFGAALFDSRRKLDGLPDEVRAYLAQHEAEIDSEADVDRLVREYDMKK